MSRNRELMRVFKDIGLVEQLGSGMSRILKAYDTSIFDISDNFMVVTFRFADVVENVVENVVDDVAENVVALMRTNNKITSKILAEKLNITQRQVQRIIAKLKKDGRIERIGSDRNGCWNVLK